MAQRQRPDAPPPLPPVTPRSTTQTLPSLAPPGSYTLRFEGRAPVAASHLTSEPEPGHGARAQRRLMGQSFRTSETVRVGTQAVLKGSGLTRNQLEQLGSQVQGGGPLLLCVEAHFKVGGTGAEAKQLEGTH